MIFNSEIEKSLSCMTHMFINVLKPDIWNNSQKKVFEMEQYIEPLDKIFL